jgi:hypothetical protein
VHPEPSAERTAVYTSINAAVAAEIVNDRHAYAERVRTVRPRRAFPLLTR